MELNQLTQLISEKLNQIGYELISLSLKKEKGENILSVIVDRVEPIDMDAIVQVSHVLNDYLDELDPLENPYTSDISSLGAEKPLKVERLNASVGKYVNVHLINPIKGENIYEGDLKEVSDDKIIIVYRQKTRSYELEILKSNIYKIRLAIKF